MRLVYLVLFTSLLAACSESSGPQAPAATNASPAVSFALSCTGATSGVYDFRAGPSQIAKRATCSGLAQHTCSRYVAGSLTEYVCETTSLLTQATVPSGCSSEYLTANHEFEDGVMRPIESYYCGALGEAECWYYRATDASNRGDLLCTN